jgi:peptidyl-prolyl cis-trans isomerase D
MLNVIRKQAGSWIVKVLLLLLVVSFAIWGIGDVFYGGGQNPAVASVGDTEISSQEVSEAFSRAVDALQRQIGTGIDRQQAIQMGLMQRALQDLVGRRLIDLEAHRLGLAVSDDQLRAIVTEDPIFQTAGRFDRTRFEQLLRANGMTEQDYFASLRQDVLRSTLTGSVVAPASVPSAMVDALYRYRNEERRGQYVMVETAAITDLPEPDEAALTDIYEADPRRFTAPQYRTLTFVTLAAEDLVEEFMPEEAAIRAAYDERQAEFRTPETRTIEQLLTKDRAVIDRARTLAQEGQGFAEIAKAMAADGVTTDALGEVTRDDLPLGLAEPAFAPAEGEVSQPAESPFGWHLFRASAIKPEQVTPFAEVRDQLAHELALAEAHERLPAVANQLDDELAAGATLAAAAEAVGLATRTVAEIDPQGRTPDGKPAEGLPAGPEFLAAAFETAEGEPSLLQETDEGAYFVVQVDRIVETRLKPLDEVRAEVVEIWQGQERERRARELAQAVRQEIAERGSIGVVARDRKLIVRQVAPIKRQGGDKDVERSVVAALFATTPGNLVEQPAKIANGFAVVMTDAVIPANPAADPTGLAQLRQQLEGEVQGDLLMQYQAALERAHTVEIDTAALGRLLSSDAADGAPPPPPPAAGQLF